MKTETEIRERIKELDSALTIIGEQPVRDRQDNVQESNAVLWNLIIKELNTLRWVLNETK